MEEDYDTPALLEFYRNAWQQKTAKILNIFKYKYQEPEDKDDIMYTHIEVEVRQSLIKDAGLGVFALGDIEAGRIIGSYGGPLQNCDGDPLFSEDFASKVNLGKGPFMSSKCPKLSAEQLNYAMTIPIEIEGCKTFKSVIHPSQMQLQRHDRYTAENNLDQILENMNWSGMMNDTKDPFRNNTVVIPNGFINTTKAIKKGEELYLEYGTGFWAEKSPDEVYITQDVLKNIQNHTKDIRDKVVAVLVDTPKRVLKPMERRMLHLIGGCYVLENEKEGSLNTFLLESFPDMGEETRSLIVLETKRYAERKRKAEDGLDKRCSTISEFCFPPTESANNSGAPHSSQDAEKCQQPH